MIGAFLKGLTLYPFPCVIPNAFAGWSEREIRAYRWGNRSLGLALACLLLVIALSGCAEAIRGSLGFVAAPVGDWIGSIGN